MAKTDANPPLPLFPGEYVLQEVSTEDLQKAVKPKQCIHMLTPETVAEAVNTAEPGIDPEDQVVFVIDEDVCTRCALCVDRCPTGVIILGKTGPAPRDGDPHQRDSNHGYAYGMRF